MLALRYILAVAIRSVLMVLGIPGNGLIIVVYFKKHRKTGTDVFLLGLAIVDFIVCVSFPLKIYSYVTSQFTSDVLCKLMHFIVSWNTYLGVYLTLAISVDRYIAVCKPLKRRVSPKQAVIIISTCAVLATFTAIPSVSKTGIQRYGPAMSKCSYSYNNLVYTKVITYFNDFLYYSCLALITVIYIQIWVAVRRQARICAEKLVGANTISGNIRPMQAAVMPFNAWAGNEAPNSKKLTQPQGDMKQSKHLADAVGESSKDAMGAAAGSRRNASNQVLLAPLAEASARISHVPMTQASKKSAPVATVRTNNKTTVMIFIITVVFFVSWIPSRIWNYYPNVKFSWVETDPVRYNIFYTSLFAVNINQVINPFIYSFVKVHFRRECVTVMRQIRQCRR